MKSLRHASLKGLRFGGSIDGLKGLAWRPASGYGTLSTMLDIWTDRERFLLIREGEVEVSIHVAVGQTLTEALIQSAVELSDPDLVFNEAGEAALAHKVVGHLLNAEDELGKVVAP